MNSRTENPDGLKREMGSRSYSMVSATYDIGNAIFTGGQNLASRLTQVEEIQPGDNVLYVGAGTAEDGLAAAKKGAKVTCIDISNAMLQKGRQRFEQAGLSAEFVCEDVMKYVPTQKFDVVVSNFFLNIFTRPVMEMFLRRVVTFIRPGGKFLIVDFAQPTGNIVLKSIQCAYVYSAMVGHWAFGLVGLHPIYDYSAYYPELGLTLTKSQKFRLFKIGPWMFESTTAIKSDDPATAP